MEVQKLREETLYMKKTKPKSLGQAAYETYWKNHPAIRGIRPKWNKVPQPIQTLYEETAKSVQRAVIRKLRREGKLK